MKFQYISDLHFEFGKFMNIEKYADSIIIAGDIGDPTQKYYYGFFKYLSEKFERIFFVAGNHEYYSKKRRSMQETETMLQEIASNFTNVFYLQNDVYHFTDSDISIFGSTMWTQIKNNEISEVVTSISDYNLIDDFTVGTCNQLHNEAKNKLEDVVNKNPERKWIVITHHMPQTRLIHPKYQKIKINSAFASDIPFLDNDNIHHVIYGHTHTPMISGKYYCNPFGYPNENPKINFNTTFEF